jgi:hypothetical protein
MTWIVTSDPSIANSLSPELLISELPKFQTTSPLTADPAGIRISVSGSLNFWSCGVPGLNATAEKPVEERMGKASYGLPEELIVQIKIRAARQRTNPSRVVEQLLTEALLRDRPVHDERD